MFKCSNVQIERPKHFFFCIFTCLFSIELFEPFQFFERCDMNLSVDVWLQEGKNAS